MGSSRPEALELTNWRCWYCGTGLTEESATIDHVVAKSRGGKAENNCVASCQPCNVMKGRCSVLTFRFKFKKKHGTWEFYGESIGLSLKSERVKA